MSSVQYERAVPRFQAGDIVMWGENRHRVIGIDCIAATARDGGAIQMTVYYRVQAIEGRCAWHKPLQAGESVLRAAGEEVAA